MEKKGQVIDFQEIKNARHRRKKKTKKKAERKGLVFLTGLTEQGVISEAKRTGEIPNLRCYLCNREHGDRSFYYGEGGEAGGALLPLSKHIVAVNERLTFIFPLCAECGV